MQVIYPLIYAFLVLMLVLTLSLSIFLLHPARKLLHKIQSSYQHIVGSQIFKYAIYLSFAIIFMILLESLMTFFTLNDHFSSKNTRQHRALQNLGLEQMDFVKTQNSESYLQVLKEYREYYMSQRNIMLACSALFVYFVFQRLFYNISKYCDLQAKIQTSREAVATK